MKNYGKYLKSPWVILMVVAIVIGAFYIYGTLEDEVTVPFVSATVTPDVSPENQPVVIDISYNFVDETPGKIRIDRYIPNAGYYLVIEKTGLSQSGEFSHTWTVPSMVTNVDGSIRVTMYNTQGTVLGTSEPSLRMLNTNY